MAATTDTNTNTNANNTTAPIEVFPDTNDEVKKQVEPVGNSVIGWIKTNAKTIIIALVILLIFYYIYITYYKGKGGGDGDEGEGDDNDPVKDNPAAAKNTQLDHNFNIKETIGEIEQKTKDILKQVSVN